jgi:hypothetical protein
MTREDEVWWWKFQIQSIAKFVKCEIVECDKRFQLWMSIAFDLKRIWHGDLYKKVFTLMSSWMTCKELRKFSLKILNCRGSKW